MIPRSNYMYTMYICEAGRDWPSITIKQELKIKFKNENKHTHKPNYLVHILRDQQRVSYLEDNV